MPVHEEAEQARVLLGQATAVVGLDVVERLEDEKDLIQWKKKNIYANVKTYF